MNEQYPMQLPAVVMPLKNGAMPGVDRFIAHWNWLELLLYGIRRVPAVHATTEAPAMVDTNAFWHELKMAGRVPFLEAQNANASVQLSDTPVFQYVVVMLQSSAEEPTIVMAQKKTMCCSPGIVDISRCPFSDLKSLMIFLVSLLRSLGS